MKRTHVTLAAGLSALSLLVLAVRPAVSQIQVLPSFVRLQAATPGTQQTGHSNITGTAIAGQFKGGGAGITGVNADLLDGIDSTSFLTSVPVPLILSGASGGQILRVTNTNPANGATAVYGLASGTSGITWGVRGDTNSTTGSGVYAVAGATSGLNYGGHFESSSNAGYGVYAAGGQVGVFGETTNNSGSAFGSFFQCSSTGGIGVYGLERALTGATNGGWFQAFSTDGTGVNGIANATTGFTTGVSGQVDSTSGVGVRGYATATVGSATGGYFVSESDGGIGVAGHTSATSGNTIGARGSSDSTNGRGVYGFTSALSGNTIGVSGATDSTAGKAVQGIANAANGTTFGGFFQSNSNTGTGVYANGTLRGVEGESGAFGMAVYGHSHDSVFGSGDGVYGQSDGINGRGVVGYVPSGSGTTYAVVGYCNSPSGWGTYSFGNSGASGVKSFRIDHPTDPENKYLLHYSAEGPEPQNFYNGVVKTNSQGEAWVQLPDYFGEINKDFRYTLTVVEDTDSSLFVQAKVSKKIADNRFKIRTSAPFTEVSWRVDAVRNDRWVQRYGAPEVVEKQGVEKGKYQHPELYGKPASMGMVYRGESTSRQKRQVSHP